LPLTPAALAAIVFTRPAPVIAPPVPAVVDVFTPPPPVPPESGTLNAPHVKPPPAPPEVDPPVPPAAPAVGFQIPSIEKEVKTLVATVSAVPAAPAALDVPAPPPPAAAAPDTNIRSAETGDVDGSAETYDLTPLLPAVAALTAKPPDPADIYIVLGRNLIGITREARPALPPPPPPPPAVVAPLLAPPPPDPPPPTASIASTDVFLGIINGFHPAALVAMQPGRIK
jgi:hypothetical protein